MDPTRRFSARAGDYARARPSYPAETLAILAAHHGLRRSSVVVDIGSGTGIFTKLLLDYGASVLAVEPNADMRAEAERSLRGCKGFTSIDGRAEATTLGYAPADLVVAAQAFHWFDVDAARAEHARIAKSHAHAAFIWNDRDTSGDEFLTRYDAILTKYCYGYKRLQGHADTPDKFDAYFGKGKWTRHTTPNSQRLDRSLLVARVMSSSYAPLLDSPEYTAMVAALGEAFDRHAENGAVTIPYETIVIGGRIPGSTIVIGDSAS